MWGKMKLVTLISSLVLYILDLASDLYVGFQHFNNGDTHFFWLTAGIIILSLFVVNIAATTVLESNVARTCGCFLHLSMIFLFVSEIRRWRAENISETAKPCPNEIHFSKCDCGTCREIVKKSVKASLKMSYVRSMETFCEAVPQLILQIIVMASKKSYPWYTIVSVVISFIFLVFNVYSLEKSFWIWKIVKSEHSDSPINYITPVNFPNRSAVAFIVWQTFLLLGRLSALLFVSVNFYFTEIAFHWAVLILSTACYLTIHKEPSADTGATDPTERSPEDGPWSLFLGHIIRLVILFPFFFPLLFHVSHSSVACLKNFIGVKCISKRFIRVLVILVPISFLVVICGQILFILLVHGYGVVDPLIIPHLAIASVYVLAFIFQAIYYSRYCHPKRVTKREWETQLRSADVRGTINIAFT